MTRYTNPLIIIIVVVVVKCLSEFYEFRLQPNLGYSLPLAGRRSRPPRRLESGTLAVRK